MDETARHTASFVHVKGNALEPGFLREIGRRFASLNALGNEGLACLGVCRRQIGDIKLRLQCQDVHLEMFEFFRQVKVYAPFELPQNKPRCFV
jgi:hypothetical protein